MREANEKKKGRVAENVEMSVSIEPLGDRALVIDWGGGIAVDTHQRIRAFCTWLNKRQRPEVIEIIPAYTTVTVIYDPMKIIGMQGSYRLSYQLDQDIAHARLSPYQHMKKRMEELLISMEHMDVGESRVVDIPVCYGGEYGPDLELVAAHAGLSVEEVIDLHRNQDYLVHMVGFAPGFPYLGGLSERLEVPRRGTPRASIAPGSVGIGGKQTGVYPISTPGGWNLIGRTPRRLFRPESLTPSLLQMGDIVRFRPITAEQYAEWTEEEL